MAPRPRDQEHEREPETRRFKPGFRCSVLDGVVLALAALGVASAVRHSTELAVLGGTAVGHFFLFCNVFRVSRGPELAWASVFLLSVVLRQWLSLDWSLLAALIVVTTGVVLSCETRKPSYHGVLWRRWNPDLEVWWERHRGASTQSEVASGSDARATRPDSIRRPH